jgi:hypothetical protein
MKKIRQIFVPASYAAKAQYVQAFALTPAEFQQIKANDEK